MLKDNLPYCSLLFFPLFFFVFPLFTFDYSSYVDEIVISRRQLQVYIRKPGIKDPVEIDKYCPLVSKNLGMNNIYNYFIILNILFICNYVKSYALSNFLF